MPVLPPIDRRCPKCGAAQSSQQSVTTPVGITILTRCDVCFYRTDLPQCAHGCVWACRLKFCA